MQQTRREWLASAVSAAAGMAVATRTQSARAGTPADGLKIGMCDWSMSQLTPQAFTVGKQIGLDGIQVSVGSAANNLWLRQEKVRGQYLQAARHSGLATCSLAMGLLNHVPLMSEPRAALWVADAIEVAKAMKVSRILLAFFAEGELKEENETDMRRVTEALRELAPRAEKAGVVLGIESYLSAEAHLKIIDAVGSDAVQVYYDVFNSHVTRGYDFRKEIKLLGHKRICEVHFKEGGNPLGSGAVDWPAAAAALKDIGYDGWLVLETSSPSGDVVADTRKNAEYVRNLFKN